MPWDDITLESPSFNAVNAGTMLRLPAAVWSHTIRDMNPAEAPVGDDEAPVKVQAGMFVEVIKITGQVSSKTALDQAIWNPTIIEGANRAALNNAEEFRDLIRKAHVAWWKEAAAGNWHNDGNPARRKGLCRLRIGDKWNGAALVPFYVYGFVSSVAFGPIVAGHKDARIFPFTIEFAYAEVQSTG